MEEGKIGIAHFRNVCAIYPTSCASRPSPHLGDHSQVWPRVASVDERVVALSQRAPSSPRGGQCYAGDRVVGGQDVPSTRAGEVGLGILACSPQVRGDRVHSTRPQTQESGEEVQLVWWRTALLRAMAVCVGATERDYLRRGHLEPVTLAVAFCRRHCTTATRVPCLVRPSPVVALEHVKEEIRAARRASTRTNGQGKRGDVEIAAYKDTLELACTGRGGSGI